MAVNKNFVVKNGLEVNDNLLVADIDTQKVGIGTSVSSYELHVLGGIGATGVHVTGITTIDGSLILGTNQNSISDGATIWGNTKISGITTLASQGGITTTGGDFYVGGDLYVADDITYDEISGRNMTISQQTTTKDLTVTGVATIASASALNVTGITTLAGQTNLSNTNVTSGIATVAGQTNLANVNVSAAATIANLTVTGSITGSSAIGIQSGGNWVSTATTTLNLSQSGLTAVTDATSGITTVTMASGVSIGLAIALGG